MKQYDLVVIGSGVGLSVLGQALNMGWACALIEDAKMGGTCLTRGCIPSKVLVYPADIIREVEHAKEIGLSFKLEKIDWDLISKRMWSQINESQEIDQGLSQAKNLTVYKGIGEFTDKYQMRVKLNTNGEYTEEFKGTRFVIASGARSIIPPIKGIQEVDYITSESFFGEKFPKSPWNSLIIIGGGVIAAEFAHMFSAFGTKVTIVEMLPRLVSTEEPEISAILENQMKKSMLVLTNTKAISTRIEANEKVVEVEDIKTGKKQEIRAEEIFLATGRRSNADVLYVEKSGIALDKQGWITTNPFLETNIKNIWAIGDANGKYQFRHKANHDAEICLQNIFGNEKQPVDYSAVPWAIYTHPTIAHVGLTEQEAIDQGYFIYVARKTYSSVAKGFAMGLEKSQTMENDGLFKLVVDQNYRIVGAHAIGPQADVLIQPFVYLMNAGFTCTVEESTIAQSLPKMAFACPEAGSFMPIYKSMVIHPSLNEVTGWALGNLRPVNIPPHGHDHDHEEGADHHH